MQLYENNQQNNRVMNFTIFDHLVDYFPITAQAKCDIPTTPQ